MNHSETFLANKKVVNATSIKSSDMRWKRIALNFNLFKSGHFFVCLSLVSTLGIFYIVIVGDDVADVK